MSGRRPPEFGNGTPADDGDQVGYGKPPAGHRFKSGISGNPAGRPRKQQAPTQECGNVTPTDRLWLNEASASVKVRQGGRVRTLPAGEAVIRSLRTKALAGSITAQRTYLDLMREAQRAAGQQQFDNFKGLIEMEARARDELTRRQAAGESIFDLLPHPDDIVIDPRNGWARLVGPITEHERDGYKPIVDMRDQLQEQVSAAALAYKNATKRGRAKWLAQWHAAQRACDNFNDLLPPSMKRDLVDRSSAPGASRANDFFEYTPEALQKVK